MKIVSCTFINAFICMLFHQFDMIPISYRDNCFPIFLAKKKQSVLSIGLKIENIA